MKSTSQRDSIGIRPGNRQRQEWITYHVINITVCFYWYYIMVPLYLYAGRVLDRLELGVHRLDDRVEVLLRVGVLRPRVHRRVQCEVGGEILKEWSARR